MRDNYDFSGAKRAQDIPHLAKLQAEAAKGKTRITIFSDDEVLESCREQTAHEGKSYQTLVNDALRVAIAPESAPITEDTLRRVLLFRTTV